MNKFVTVNKIATVSCLFIMIAACKKSATSEEQALVSKSGDGTSTLVFTVKHQLLNLGALTDGAGKPLKLTETQRDEAEKPRYCWYKLDKVSDSDLQKFNTLSEAEGINAAIKTYSTLVKKINRNMLSFEQASALVGDTLTGELKNSIAESTVEVADPKVLDKFASALSKENVEPKQECTEPNDFVVQKVPELQGDNGLSLTTVPCAVGRSRYLTRANDRMKTIRYKTCQRNNYNRWVWIPGVGKLKGDDYQRCDCTTNDVEIYRAKSPEYERVK